MSDSKRTSQQSPTLEELAQRAPLPEWVREMSDHYRLTGSYRTEDLRKLLGDPNKRVEVGERASLGAMMQDGS